MGGVILAALLAFGGDLDCPVQPDELLPDLGEIERLPTRDEAGAAIRANWKFTAWIWQQKEAARKFDPQYLDLGRIEFAEVENEHLFNAWQLISAIRSPHRDPIDRARDLNRLRAMMGDEAYLLGQWPAPYPWWRLPRD